METFLTVNVLFSVLSGSSNKLRRYISYARFIFHKLDTQVIQYILLFHTKQHCSYVVAYVAGVLILIYRPNGMQILQSKHIAYLKYCM